MLFNRRIVLRDIPIFPRQTISRVYIFLPPSTRGSRRRPKKHAQTRRRHTQRLILLLLTIRALRFSLRFERRRVVAVTHVLSDSVRIRAPSSVRRCALRTASIVAVGRNSTFIDDLCTGDRVFEAINPHQSVKHRCFANDFPVSSSLDSFSAPGMCLFSILTTLHYDDTYGTALENCGCESTRS